MDQDVRLRNPGYPQVPPSDMVMGYVPVAQGQCPPPSQYGYNAAAYPTAYPGGAQYPAQNFLPSDPPYGASYSYANLPPNGQPSSMPSLFDSSSVTNNMMMSFGMQYGQKMLRRTQDNFSRYFFSLEGLRYYFTVNNSYVKNKIKVLLFPLRHKFRRREIDRQSHYEKQLPPGTPQTCYYLPAVEDINAPDLYIPLMGFITYVLLFGLFAGIHGRHFSPEVLINTGSSCLLLLLLEIFVLRIGCYILAMPRPVFAMDLLCWNSYKYVGVSTCLVLRAVLFPWLFTAVWIGLSLFHGYFMYKSLQFCCAGSGHSIHSYALYMVAALQVPVYMWLMHF
jgi:hypothetical protein